MFSMATKFDAAGCAPRCRILSLAEALVLQRWALTRWGVTWTSWWGRVSDVWRVTCDVTCNMWRSGIAKQQATEVFKLLQRDAALLQFYQQLCDPHAWVMQWWRTRRCNRRLDSPRDQRAAAAAAALMFEWIGSEVIVLQLCATGAHWSLQTFLLYAAANSPVYMLPQTAAAAAAPGRLNPLLPSPAALPALLRHTVAAAQRRLPATALRRVKVWQAVHLLHEVVAQAFERDEELAGGLGGGGGGAEFDAEVALCLSAGECEGFVVLMLEALCLRAREHVLQSGGMLPTLLQPLSRGQMRGKGLQCWGGQRLKRFLYARQLGLKRDGSRAAVGAKKSKVQHGVLAAAGVGWRFSNGIEQGDLDPVEHVTVTRHNEAGRGGGVGKCRLNARTCDDAVAAQTSAHSFRNTSVGVCPPMILFSTAILASASCSRLALASLAFGLRTASASGELWLWVREQ